jgi:hypothetical protein
MDGALDVRTFGAVGDGLHDDTEAIQHALDVPGAVVLLPKGYYRISKTLTLAKGGATALIGVARHLSLLMVSTDGIGGRGTERVFRQNFALEDAIGSRTCSLQANMRLTKGIPLGSPLL